jgi:hypothetical protein
MPGAAGLDLFLLASIRIILALAVKAQTFRSLESDIQMSTLICNSSSIACHFNNVAFFATSRSTGNDINFEPTLPESNPGASFFLGKRNIRCIAQPTYPAA